MNQQERPTFGALLQRFRVAAALSQEELAERSGVTPGAISALEREVRRAPYQNTVARLAAGLELSPQEYALIEATAREQRSRKQVAEASVAPADVTSVQPVSYAQSRAHTTPDLVGREREWEWLRGELAIGRPLLLLSGEPGIGKTRMLHEAMGWARRHGWSVLWGDCHRRSGQEPYAPLVEALERHTQALTSGRRRMSLQGCEWLARLLPELAISSESATLTSPGALSSAQEQRLMFAAVERYLSNIAGSAGTLLVLDDLQWAGDDALRLLTRLIQSAHTRRLRILGAFRSTEAAPGSPLSTLIADLAREDLVSQIELAPLESRDALAMASAVLENHGTLTSGTEGRALLEDVVKRAEGVPFVIVSYALRLPLSTTQQVKDAPKNVAQNILERVAALPAPARDLLAAAAVIGQLASCETLAASVGQSEMVALDSLDIACRAGLLYEEPEVDQPERYRCHHEVIRDVVEASLTAARQIALHRRVAAALEQALRRREETGHVSDRLLAQVAYHYARADAPEQAARYLRRAGDHARHVYAHQEAAQYYQELAVWLDRLESRREGARARKDLAAELARLGRFAEAVGPLEEAEAMAQASGDLETLALVTMASGHLRAALGASKAGLDLVRPLVETLSAEEANAASPGGMPAPMVAQLHGALSGLAFMVGHYRDALEAAERAVDLARDTGDAGLLAREQVLLGVALFTVGRLVEAIDQLQRAAEGAEAVGDLETLAEALRMASWAYQTRGAFAKGQAAQTRSLALSERLKDVVGFGHTLFLDALLAFYTGKWEHARAIAQNSLDIFQMLGAVHLSAYPPLGLGWLSMIEGDQATGEAYLAEAERIALQSGPVQVLRFITALRAERELLAGRADMANRLLLPWFTDEPMQERTRLELSVLRAWAAVALDMEDDAHTLTSETVESARANKMYLVLPDALRVQALWAIRRQRWAEAERALDEASRLSQAMPYPYAEAKALYVYGQLWAARDEPEQARAFFEQALAICQQLGERLYGGAIELRLHE
jgi:tetratricopeptide (TPR) repeat protein/transcriptional regulator with XRE-family HTH domain